MRIARVPTGHGWAYAADSGDGWRLVDGADASDITRSLPQLSALSSANLEGARIEPSTFGSPVIRPGKMIAVGLNYMDHIRETGAQPPPRPILFAKFPSSIVGPYDDVVIEADLTTQGDYEVELAIVIGRNARRIAPADALGYVFGYLVANDVSARDWQKVDVQLSRSKSMDTFCPLGPWITTSDEVPDPNQLALRSKVNGETRQESSTAEMIFSVAEVVSFCSQTMTLEPGDVILTGTPHGVGFARNPPVFLSQGDVVRCEIDGLGAIENRVVGRPVTE